MLERLAQPLRKDTLEASCMFGTGLDMVALVPWSRMANPGARVDFGIRVGRCSLPFGTAA